MELKLNKAKVNHLLGLLEINEREGWYYGNKEHYLKRHNALKAELKLLITDVGNPLKCDFCGANEIYPNLDIKLYQCKCGATKSF